MEFRNRRSDSAGAQLHEAESLCLGSDDGFVYCLDTAKGQLVWKRRLGPADESILARGEMISCWPIRTGVLVDGGIAYFGAGIFPHENVYLAAVDAATGEWLWKNEKLSHRDAGRDSAWSPEAGSKGGFKFTDDSNPNPRPVPAPDGTRYGRKHSNASTIPVSGFDAERACKPNSESAQCSETVWRQCSSTVRYRCGWAGIVVPRFLVL